MDDDGAASSGSLGKRSNKGTKRMEEDVLHVVMLRCSLRGKARWKVANSSVWTVEVAAADARRAAYSSAVLTNEQRPGGKPMAQR